MSLLTRACFPLSHTIVQSSLLFCLLVWAASPVLARDEGVTRHDFHVSIARIDYNAGTESFEIALKIFTDDLELSLEGYSPEPMRLGTPREHPLADSLIFSNISHSFSLVADQKPLKLEFVGKEVELDVTWCYLEIRNIPLPKSLTIRNKMLMDRFEDQMNIVHVYAGGKKHSVALKRSMTEENLELGY